MCASQDAPALAERIVPSSCTVRKLNAPDADGVTIGWMAISTKLYLANNLALIFGSGTAVANPLEQRVEFLDGEVQLCSAILGIRCYDSEDRSVSMAMYHVRRRIQRLRQQRTSFVSHTVLRTP